MFFPRFARLAHWSATVALVVAGALHASACTGARGATERSGSVQGAAARPRLATAPAPDGKLFTRMPSGYTGVDFTNHVLDTQEQNPFTYRSQYHGGGVALGDLTGDGLPEIVLTSNQGGTRLYVNEGHFRFRDVTDEAGVRGNGAWTTGVTIADVNGDGKLDIYVCHAGTDASRRANELWINQGVDSRGVPHFKEEAAAYGIADRGYGEQAVFFDYDHDGRLDLLVVRNSPKPVTGFGLRNTRNVRDSLGGARLYHNDGGADHPHFHDVSAKAGIFGPENAYGLGVVVADVNRDGWPDIYISHDYYERDYLYLNNGDGTFTESLDKAMTVDSYFSMGLDVADLDNDGWPEIYTTDMLPEGDERLKTVTAYEGWDVYQAKIRIGYGYQLMRNMLQHNNGVGPAGAGAAGLTFSDVGQMAGVARTDWSWGALIVDLDLDGLKDVYVTNGVAKDQTNQDFIAYAANQETMRAVTASGHVDYMMLVGAMPSTPIPNYAFQNTSGTRGNGGLAFANRAVEWGLDTPSLSNGAAYADLDGDGAPDLVVNNVDQEAFVYRNNARTLLPNNHYLQVRLEGEGANRFGVGARVTVRSGTQQFYQELSPTRGYESSSDYLLTFGLGARPTVDSVTVDWPDGRTNVLRAVATNQRLTVRHADAGAAVPILAPAVAAAMTARLAGAHAMVADVTDAVRLGFVHHENDFVDFDRDRLIPKMLSTEGPALAVADVNGDGLDDLYFGGAKDQPGELLVQQPNGTFVKSNPGLFEQDAVSEDVGAVFFDANGDGKPDLYVVSGGNEFGENAPALQDRLYLNDGAGHFHKAPYGSLPAETEAGSRAVAADYDGDGDQDLFVGGRVVPWKYGIAPRSMLLQNDGHGHFTDVTDRLAPELAHVGMVTDAVWRDVDGDGRLDLVVVGEWMPITIFHNEGGGRLKKWAVPGLARSNGWWNRIIAGDFTGHGRVDFIVGNLGLNARLHASEREPAQMYVKDFDGNGIVEQIVTQYSGGASYPITLRDDLIKALPFLKARYPSYKQYAKQRITDVFTPKELEGATVQTAYTFATSLVRNDGGGRFTVVPLPAEAQLSPVYGLLARDLDGDGTLDLMLAGNFDGVKPEIGRMAASYGLVLRGDGQGHFTPLRPAESGLFVPGQTRDIAVARTHAGPLLVIARNNDRPMLFRPTGGRSATVVANIRPMHPERR